MDRSPDDLVRDLASRARVAARALALETRAAKDAALVAMADGLVGRCDEVLAANADDLARADEAGTPDNVVDRLRLTPERVAGMAQGLRDVAGLPDPVGEVVRGSTLANGLELRQVRVPFGVVAMVYEARPNVTADAAGICLKSGNAVLLRGSSSAASSNRAVVGVLRDAAAAAGLPRRRRAAGPRRQPRDGRRADAGAGAGRRPGPARGRRADPLGRRGVDRAGDRDRASATATSTSTPRPTSTGRWRSSSTPRPSAPRSATPPSRCSSTRRSQPTFVPRVVRALQEAGVTVHGDAGFAAEPGVVAATDDDWGTEYLSLDISARVVPDLDAAIDHIHRHGSGHSEAIVTEDQAAARRFVAAVDSAAVLVNASTRFTDGGEFGFGAEIGISTQKLHARGPMGLPEMTTTKYVVTGEGHVR